MQQRLGLCWRQRHRPLGDDNQGVPRKGKAAPSSLTGLNQTSGFGFLKFFNCWFGNNFDPQKTQATQAPARLLRPVPGCRRLGPFTCPLDPLPACVATWRSAWTIGEQGAFLLCPKRAAVHFLTSEERAPFRAEAPSPQPPSAPRAWQPTWPRPSQHSPVRRGPPARVGAAFLVISYPL